jgi:hypothetical protein
MTKEAAVAFVDGLVQAQAAATEEAPATEGAKP